MPKLFLLTHNDLDGDGAAVVAAHFFGEPTEIVNTNYDTVDKDFVALLERAIQAGKDEIQLPRFLVTDIRPHDPDLFVVLENARRSDQVRPLAIDHHETPRDYLKRVKGLSWLTLVQGKCATLQLFEILNQLFQNGQEEATHLIDKLHDFARVVDAWDTWKIDERPEDYADGKRLNRLHRFLGHKRFFQHFSEDSDARHFGEQFEQIHDILLEKEEEAIEEVAKKILADSENIRKDPLGRLFVFAPAPMNVPVSVIAPRLFAENPEFQYVVFYLADKGVLSFRSRDDSVSVVEIAQKLGGGGHPAAAGAFSENIKDEVFHLYYNHLQKGFEDDSGIEG